MYYYYKRSITEIREFTEINKITNFPVFYDKLPEFINGVRVHIDLIQQDSKNVNQDATFLYHALVTGNKLVPKLKEIPGSSAKAVKYFIYDNSSYTELPLYWGNFESKEEAWDSCNEFIEACYEFRELD